MKRYKIVRTYNNEDVCESNLQKAFDDGYELVRASEYVPETNYRYGYIEYILVKEERAPLDDVLDKIRTEMEGCEDKIRSRRDYDKAEYTAYIDAITDMLVIFDKYNGESEDKK